MAEIVTVNKIPFRSHYKRIDCRAHSVLTQSIRFYSLSNVAARHVLRSARSKSVCLP